MATGIVSAALLLTGTSVLSMLLWIAGFVFLAFFVVVYLLGWLMYPGEVRQDTTDPNKVFSLFTTLPEPVERRLSRVLDERFPHGVTTSYVALLACAR